MSKRTAGTLLFMILGFLACAQVITPDAVPASTEGERQSGRTPSSALVLGD